MFAYCGAALLVCLIGWFDLLLVVYVIILIINLFEYVL